ncbi:ATP-binding protein [Streptomyces sp. NBC_00237]|uniref:ATP-binding protein n=1 Tax=Streptomyces sp. NBC_00237 TaxID=2975687 RepID=UPI00224C9F71|nr:ATP-binding protein [Streptomyces sp. NBC_00237]MCX5204526.1 ATP-binding protein [Streptomyces sp. NBC_00237]
MHQTATPTHMLCPVADRPDAPSPTRTAYDEADNLAVSLTVPGEPRSAGIVRRALTGALHAHHLDRYGPVLALVVTELIAVAGELTSDADLYVSLRHHHNTLRLIVWDQHPPHADPDATSLCFVRRRRALWLLAEAVEDWGGEWGVDEALPPHRGIKSWVTLPR